MPYQTGVDNDPELRQLPLELTEPVDTGPADTMPMDREETVQKALVNSPALKANTQRLDVDDLQIHAAKNALLPNLTFNAGYTSNGLGGIFDPNKSSLIGGGASFLPVIPGGIADALGQMFGFNDPTSRAGLPLQFPLRS